jgi:ankyrin repeat protein
LAQIVLQCGEPSPKKEATLGTKKATDHILLEGDRKLSGTMVDRRFQAAETQIRDGAYPLHMAIASKASRNIIEMLMREAPDVLGMTNKYGETPLHVALSCIADTETVELLLHMKEDIDALKKAEKRHGKLPLHLAAIRGCSDGVAVLLLTEYPAAAGVANAKGKTPLDLALELGHCSNDFLHLLEKYGVSE